MGAFVMWAVVVTILGLASAAPSLAAGYCSLNTLPINSTFMHFTKEPVPYEYGFVDKFKSIHCCVKGYRSIEWFKDGVAYPWSAGVSNLILYPEAANQTLYTRRAARSDAGNYTCRLSNETHSETHTVVVDILEKPTDAPKTMYISKDQWLEEDKPLRLFCEALIGQSYLADARSDLRWYKVWPNGTEGELLPTQTEIKTTRDDMEDIIGAYLTVERVSVQDYGTYACVVHSNSIVSRNYVTVHYRSGVSGSNGAWSSSGGVPWRLLALGGAAAALLLLSVTALHARCTPRLLLTARHWRDRARTPAHRARVLEKEFDVLVCWTSVDGELVRGALLPTLALKYKYRVHSVPLPADPDTWYSVLAGEAGRCRSLVAVISPAQHSPTQLLTALRQLRALPLPPVVVLLQDLPDLKREAKDAGESLVAVLRRTRLVAWRHVHERDFWTQLRLALPLPPPPHAQRQTQSTAAETEESKNSRSGSMTALV
ncbi:fibroblast growth factor receptor 3-like [Pectinophora gossypiella]|uniref:fibroblast growth factor receptor 3-like n=1 Tax=Pectinophora gossypiella TaxID=13191 RepID=UPI00214E7D0F|nr:fibroblast growth factor receptor 3-like [Pectinophora gossypiella]